MNREQYMQRCLQLASLGLGYVHTNPLVGAVVVHGDRIIGEGYHERYGAAHAEVNALRNVSEKHLLQDSTLFINLEPCSHTGKTPPCTELILKSGIPRVVIAMQDPFPAVNGRGIALLEKAGVEVVTGISEAQALHLNRRFICYHTKNRPYLVLKWAQSKDGYAGVQDQPIRISNDDTRLLSHRWRREEAGIIAGAGTILCDNPQLNNRLGSGPQPVRIILDRSGRLSGRNNLHVFNGEQRTLIFTLKKDAAYAQAEKTVLEDSTTFLRDAMNIIRNENIVSCLCEGGPTLHREFIRQGLWDECRTFVAPVHLVDGIPAAKIPNGETMVEMIGSDQFITVYKEYK